MRGLNKKMMLLPILAMSLLASIAMVKPSFADGTTTYITPVMNGPGDFSVDVMVEDVTDLYGYEFKVQFDKTLLVASSIEVGDFFPIPPGYVVWKNEIGENYAWLAVTRPFGTASGKSGSGRLATIYFTDIPETTGACYLELYSLMGDPFGGVIDHEALWGYYSDVVPTTLLADLVKRRDMVRPEEYEFAFSKELKKGEDLIQTLYGGLENLGTVPVRVGAYFTLIDAEGNVIGPLQSALVVLGPTTPGKPMSISYDWPAVLGTYTCQVDVFYDSNGDGQLDTHGETVRSFEFCVVPEPLK